MRPSTPGKPGLPFAPDELATSLLLTGSSDPDKPPVVNVFGAMLGTRSDTEELLDGLVVLVASLERASYRATKSYRDSPSENLSSSGSR